MFYCQLVHAEIKELRKARGLSQAALVEKSGAGLRTIQSWNSGNDIEAQDDIVLAIFESLGLSEDDAETLINELKTKAKEYAKPALSFFKPLNDKAPSTHQPRLNEGHKFTRSISHYSSRAIEKPLGRVDEQEKLDRFLADLSRPFCWMQMAGEGGQGKTRLAYELILKARKQGWKAGFLFKKEFEQFEDKWQHWQPDTPHLLVVDYLIGREHDVGPMLHTLLARASEFRAPVRLLLLERQRWDRSDKISALITEGRSQFGHSDWFDALADKHECSTMGIEEHQFEDAMIELTDLGADLLVEITREIAKQGGAKLSLTDGQIKQELANIDKDGRPLYAYFLGQSLVDKPSETGWNRETLLQYVLKKGRGQRWEQAFGEDYALGSGERAEKLAVLATMIGTINCNELKKDDELFAAPPKERRQALALVDGGFNADSVSNDIPPLQPDILGEYFVLQAFDQGLDVVELAELAWQLRPEGMVEFLVRILRDFPTHDQIMLLISHVPKGEAQIHYDASSSDLLAGLQACNKRYPNEIIRALHRQAENGDATAIANLAARYHLGDGVRKDWNRAFELYESAIAKGHTGAIYNLAVCYETGEVVQQNYSRSSELYTQAARLGFVPSVYNLAVFYHRGMGVKRDIFKAVELYRDAAKRGHLDAINNLATCYYHGEGVVQDQAKAVKFYEQAVEGGNTGAMHNLAHCYQNGLGVEKDWGRAIKFYEKAVAGGEVTSMVSLAHHYHKGDVVEQNVTKAIALYEQAVEHGNAGAMYNLALCFGQGDGVTQDANKASKLLQESAKLGFKPALQLIDYFLSKESQP